MDQRDFETHYISKQGIENFRNPLIRALATKDKRESKKVISPFNVSFAIVPAINCITRVGTQEEKELVFNAMLEWKAYNLIPSNKRGHAAGEKETILDQALRTCTNVKSRQNRIRDAGIEDIERIIERDNLLNGKLLLIKLRQGDIEVDPGVRGLIANELMAKYQRPVAILAEIEHEGKKAWMGSARGYEKSELTDFRQFCKDSDLTFLTAG